MHIRPVRQVLVIAIGLLAFVGRAAAQPSSGVAGTWNVTMMSHQVALVLTQEGTAVTGTLTIRGQEVPVTGTFVDGAMTLSANAMVMTRPEGGAESPSTGHADAATSRASSGSASPTKLTMTATLLDDGTLAGEMASPSGPLAWTGERLRERPTPGTRASSAPPSEPGLTGRWKMSVAMPTGAMEFGLTLTQRGTKVTGTLSSDHSGDLPLEGTLTDGTLTLSSGGGPSSSPEMRLSYTATQQSDGSLKGELVGPMGRMAWTAERAKPQ